MTAFTDLPYEIREQIYKLSLVTGWYTICPYPTMFEELEGYVADRDRDWTIDERLAVGLLGTTKQARTEAAKIIFGMNSWHLSGRKQLPATQDIDWPEAVWKAHRDDFRSVVVNFDSNDLEGRSTRQCNRRDTKSMV
ncbi:MAG: hypothetical protein Q9169_007002 [Polycauliona sp. 2 TL-2023]